MKRVWVDADACPVKFEIIEICRRFYHTPRFVSCQPIKAIAEHPSVELVMVDEGSDAVDDLLVESSAQGDVVVTTDLLLSQRLLEKGVRVVNFAGEALDADAVAEGLARRRFRAMVKENGQELKARQEKSKSIFKNRFHNLLDQTLS